MDNSVKKIDKERGKGLPQILHDRARSSAIELHKLLVSLSTAILTIFFLAVTTEIKPPLTPKQKFFVLFSLIAFGSALFSGLIA
jgi:hypothetical protein